MRRLIPIVLITSLLLFFFVNVAEAGQTDNVFGWAWSENIGWISFNCYNDYDGDGIPESHCAPDPGYASDYGVNVDLSTGDFSGYAWSENIGWITLNSSELSGCPSAPCEARLDFATNEVSGWARACSVFQLGCSGVLNPNRGGWDGWIKLKGDLHMVARDEAPSPDELKGWAWGGDPDGNDGESVVGWISFNCRDRGVCGRSDYKVFVGEAAFNKPEARDLNISGQKYCLPDASSGQGTVFFNWRYCDGADLNDDGLCNGSSGNQQSQFQLQVYDSDFSSPAVNRIQSSDVSSGSYNDQLVYVVVGGGGLYSDNLNFNTTYHWRVKVWDSTGNESDWISGPDFTTEVDPYPYPQIDFYPSLPYVNQEITFTTSTTECWGDCSTYKWTFWNEDSTTVLKSVTCPGGSTICPWATMEYTVVGSYPVDLTITDNSSVQQCSVRDTVKIGKLPRWREVPPVSWIFDIFQTILKIPHFYN